MVYALTVVIELTSAAQLPRLVAAFAPLHAVSNDPAREPGCMSYELLRANDCEKTVIILERFANQHAHKETHRASRPFQAFSAWLRGEAMRDDLPGGRIVQSVNGRHFVSAGKCTAADGTTAVEIPADILRLSRVERVVRRDVDGAGKPLEGAAEGASSLVDPASFRYEQITDGVLVFGGARDGARKEYCEVAHNIGVAIGKAGRRVVYGGGTVGVMCKIALAAQANGSPQIIGIIPEALMPRELSGDCIGTVVVTADMNERKRVMFAASSSIICLPGGVGTLDELFEALTLVQLNAIKHKIVLVNACGFFDPVVALLQHQIQEGFVDKSVLDYFILYNGGGADVMDKLEAMPAPKAAAQLDWSKRE